MTQEEFNVVFELQMRKCSDILAHKKKEYTGDNLDRLSGRYDVETCRISLRYVLFQPASF